MASHFRGSGISIEKVLIEVHRADRTVVDHLVDQPIGRLGVQQREYRPQIDPLAPRYEIVHRVECHPALHVQRADQSHMGQGVLNMGDDVLEQQLLLRERV